MKLPIFIRQVRGVSMTPTLKAGNLVIISKSFKLKKGMVVVAKLNDLEVVKRVESVNGMKVFLIGDNPQFSSDSRSYGWLGIDQIIGKIIWPKLDTAI